MSKIDISGFTTKMRNASKIKETVMPKAYNDFVNTTPIDTGNARSNTKLQNYVIIANYAYAKVLDAGRRMTSKGMRGSNQQPFGMRNPTIVKIKQYVSNFIRTL